MRFLGAVFLSLFAAAAGAATLSGVVRDAGGQPVVGAVVSIDGQRDVATDARGAFAFEVAAGAHSLRVAKSGFRADVREITGGEKVDVTLEPSFADAIVVSGIRAEAKVPVTKTDLPRERIAEEYYGQDIPQLLRDTPSINSYTEAGIGGSGYSYITLRGLSPTRINFTLDGVPLADSEDMGTYFADFPDLASSLQSIQIQRGVGTSTVGSPSFGGSINLQSVDLSDRASVEARAGGGSFGTKMGTLAWQSGPVAGGFSLYARMSANQSDGFRESSGVRQRNLFFSAAKQNETSQLRLTGFTAHEYSQLAFFAADADTLKTNLRANPLSPDDRDSFGYDLAQLQYLRALSDRTNLTASAYYQRGYGWYRLYDDETTRSGLRQYGLDGMLIGTMLTMSTTSGPLTASYGLHVNEFRREHTRDLVDGPRDYYNYGTKGEANAFAKLAYDAGRWHLNGDAQLRTADFHYHGDVRIDPIRWTFFNPRVGARYDLSARSSVYGSTGLSTREPTRNDLFQGEDNASFAHDLHAVRPERLVDLEAGWELHGSTLAVAANVYAMEFRHEIASTGELSDIGLLLRRNVDRSYRRGIELDATWRASPRLRFRSTANVSRNRIASWTQFYDVYDADGNIVGSEPRVYHNVTPVLTPGVIVSQAVESTPTPRLTLGAVGRYVGKQYLDNTSNADFTTPSFFGLDANAAFAITSEVRVKLQLNNILNNKRIEPSGYDYVYLNRDGAGQESFAGTSYYFPQATRSAVVMVDFKR